MNTRFGCGVVTALVAFLLLAVYIVAAFWTGTPEPWSGIKRAQAATERQGRAEVQQFAQTTLVSTTTPTPTPLAPVATPTIVVLVIATATPDLKGPATIETVQPSQVITSTEGVTTEVAKGLFGVDVQRLAEEPSAFVWRSQGVASTTAICPLGWICTWSAVGDITVVHEGVGQTAEITAGTWRQMTFYPEGVCTIFQKEKAFGASEVPSFQVRYQFVTGAPENCDS